jgi:hypothetical protein
LHPGSGCMGNYETHSLSRVDLNFLASHSQGFIF